MNTYNIEQYPDDLYSSEPIPIRAKITRLDHYLYDKMCEKVKNELDNDPRVVALNLLYNESLKKHDME